MIKREECLLSTFPCLFPLNFPTDHFQKAPIVLDGYNRSDKWGSAKLQSVLGVNSRNLGFMCLKWAPEWLLKVEWKWNNFRGIRKTVYFLMSWISIFNTVLVHYVLIHISVSTVFQLVAKMGKQSNYIMSENQ